MPEPACDPHTPIPFEPVPLLIPRIAAEKVPGEADEIFPMTPNAFAFVEELIPSKPAPVPLFVIEMRFCALLKLFEYGRANALVLSLPGAHCVPLNFNTCPLTG